MTDETTPNNQAPKAKAAQRPGFDKEGKPYPGVDPKTGKRKALTLEGAKAEFGEEGGEEVYRQIMVAGGYGIHDHDSLLLVGLEEGRRAEVERILAEAATKAEGGKV